MSWPHRAPNKTILLLVPLLGLAACSRPLTNQSTEAARTVPFRDGDERSAADSGTESQASRPDGMERGSGVPFREQTLPAGTLLTVRLETDISYDNSDATSAFAAVIDEPVVIEGATMVPRGATVAGRIQSGQPPTGTVRRGYVRMTLNQMDIAGKDLPIQTSDLFARGDFALLQARADAGVVSLEQGRRLTFRLSEPASLSVSSAMPYR